MFLCKPAKCPIPALLVPPSACSDHYENMYAVLTGTKVFTLLPPCDVWRMGIQRYPAARWTKQSQPCREHPGGDGLVTKLLGREAQEGVAEGGLAVNKAGGGEAVAESRNAEAAAEGSIVPPPPSAPPSRSRWLPVLSEEPDLTVAWCAIDPRPGGSCRGQGVQEPVLFH